MLRRSILIGFAALLGFDTLSQICFKHAALGAAPLRIERRATLVRAVCRFAVGDDEGVGWATWLDSDEVLGV